VAFGPAEIFLLAHLTELIFTPKGSWVKLSELLTAAPILDLEAVSGSKSSTPIVAKKQKLLYSIVDRTSRNLNKSGLV